MLSDAIKVLEKNAHKCVAVPTIDGVPYVILRKILTALGEPSEQLDKVWHDIYANEIRCKELESRLSALEAKYENFRTPAHYHSEDGMVHYPESPAIPVLEKCPRCGCLFAVMVDGTKFCGCRKPEDERGIAAIPAKPEAQGVEEKIRSVLVKYSNWSKQDYDNGFLDMPCAVSEIISLVRSTRPDVVEVPRDVAKRYLESEDSLGTWSVRRDMKNAIKKALEDGNNE